MNPDRKEESLFIKCECLGHWLELSKYFEHGEYCQYHDLSFIFWERHDMTERSIWDFIKERLKITWGVLTRGKAQGRGILIANRQDAEKLLEFVKGYIEDLDEFEKKYLTNNK